MRQALRLAISHPNSRAALGSPFLRADQIRRSEMPSGVVVIGLYLIFAVLGSVGAWAIGLAVEARTSQALSLIVFLTLFFSALIIAWPIAARLTEKLLGKDPEPEPEH